MYPPSRVHLLELQKSLRSSRVLFGLFPSSCKLPGLLALVLPAGRGLCAGAAGSSGRSGLVFHSYSKGSEQTVLETVQELWYSTVAAGADNIAASECTVVGWVLIQTVLLVGVPGKSSSGAGVHHQKIQL